MRYMRHPFRAEIYYDASSLFFTFAAFAGGKKLLRKLGVDLNY